MAITVRKNAAALTTELFNQIYEFDFPQAVRILNKLNKHRFSPGSVDDPKKESVHFSARISFAVSSADLFSLQSGTPPLLTVTFLGVAGIQGPLPDIYTEILIDRHKVKDEAAKEFFDLFNHRLITFWYKHAVSLYPHLDDAPLEKTKIGQCLSDLAGVEYHSHKETLLTLAPLYWQKTPSAVGLQTILESYFKVPVNVQCHHGSWLTAEKEDLTQLAKNYSRLGHSTILGKLTYHQSSSFAVSIGPLSYSIFSEFLPNDNLGSSYFVFKEFVLAYFSCPPHYQMCLKLNKNEIPPTYLNNKKQLGYNTWLYSKVSDYYENHVWLVGAK